MDHCLIAVKLERMKSSSGWNAIRWSWKQFVEVLWLFFLIFRLDSLRIDLWISCLFVFFLQRDPDPWQTETWQCRINEFFFVAIADLFLPLIANRVQRNEDEIKKREEFCTEFFFYFGGPPGPPLQFHPLAFTSFLGGARKWAETNRSSTMVPKKKNSKKRPKWRVTKKKEKKRTSTTTVEAVDRKKPSTFLGRTNQVEKAEKRKKK